MHGSIRPPPDVHWACLQCGHSCRDWTEVALEPEEAERLRRLPMFAIGLPALSDGLPYVPSTREGGPLSLRFTESDDGAAQCIFLRDDGLCAVHAAHGDEAKPGSCRAFPFFFVDAPDGLRAAVSFACTAVLRDHGPPIGAAAVAEIDSFAQHRERRGRHLLLAPGHPLSWRAYIELERRLGDLFAASEDVPAALLGQAHVLRRAAGYPAPDRRASTRLATATRDWLLDLGRVPPSRRPPLAPVPVDPPQLLRRWLAHRLWRRDLLRGGQVLLAHGLLLAETAIACWWARTEPGGMAAAIAQVERGFSVHGTIVDQIENRPTVATRAGRLFLSPRYAASQADAITRALLP